MIAPPNQFVVAGLKRAFHKLETYGDQCLQIPVFTGMTGFGAVLRVDGKNDIANRRAVYGLTLERRLLKQALKTRLDPRESTKSPSCAYVHDRIGMPGWAEGGFETHPYKFG